jgi:hypothetical protein
MTIDLNRDYQAGDVDTFGAAKYSQALKALIPPGGQYDLIASSISQMLRLFPSELHKIDPADISRWASEIDAGTRTESSIRNDIFKYFVGTEKIMSTLGVDQAGADALISGSKAFADVQAPAKLDPGKGVTDVDPLKVGSTIIPQGGRLVRVTNPTGADASELYFIAYDWMGLELVYEVGDKTTFTEMFGSIENFTSFSTLSQSGFDSQGFTEVGSVGQIAGSTESLGSQIERETRALGLEDLPAWLRNAPDALALVAQGTAQEWSSGRLWQELSGTGAFTARFGGALDNYLTGNVTISDAVNQLVADENALRTAIRPFAGEQASSTEYLHGLLNEGWTPGAAAQVLEQADIFRSDPTSFTQANLILEASGLGSIDEVEFLNALSGFGIPDVVEALNTAAAATALQRAGLEDVDIDLLMEVVDTSDRLLTTDSFASLSQELALNTVRFGHELEDTKLGFTRDDLIAAAFGETNPNGKTPGEVINALARFQRDRQAAGSGFEQTAGFQDEKGRLRIAGLGGL